MVASFNWNLTLFFGVIVLLFLLYMFSILLNRWCFVFFMSLFKSLICKPSIYEGTISSSRLNILTTLTCFSIGTTLFNYLGVSIFKGRPKARFLHPVTDKVINNLASWKWYLLSFFSRVELVKSIILWILFHSTSFYAWLITLVRDLERAARNFIWSGEASKTKLVTMAWNHIYKPISKGGLRLRSLVTLNESANLKLGWDLLNLDEPWAILLRHHAFRNNKIINHHIFSFIWYSVKHETSKIREIIGGFSKMATLLVLGSTIDVAQPRSLR